MQPSIQRSRGAVVGCLSAALVCTVVACGATTQGDAETIGTANQAIGNYNYTDHRAWSQSPPGGLTPSQAPMFVQIGFDDNQRSGLNTSPPSGMTWATTFFRGLRNPAGSGNAATFDNAPV